MLTRRRLAVAVAAAALAACSGGQGRAAGPTASHPSPPRPASGSAAEAPATATTSPATTSPAPPVVPLVPEPAGCPPVPARVAPPADRPRYALRVDVRLAENRVEGEVAVVFRPDLDVDRLVFRLWPNAPAMAAAGARLEPGAVRVGGASVAGQRPDPTTLVVPLAAPVRAGQPVEASVAWTLTLPGPVAERVSRSGDAVRLGSFFPLLAWEPGVGFATEPATAVHGEASTAPVADFAATVRVPEGLGVLATGVPDGPGRWSATAVLDFALSVGRFRTETATVAAPQPVSVTVGVAEGVDESPRPYLDKAVAVLGDFARRFGPYPWPSYTVAVAPALSGGIEYPMHVMQGPGSLGRTTSHEVAHQWFYGLVSSNQGRDPWLDEGLATWAEARFEDAVAALATREVPPEGRGHAGEPMTYWESRAGAYYRSVYVQSAAALSFLGPPELVDCALRHYVARSAYRVARPADLLASLRLVFPDAAARLAPAGLGG